MFWQSTVLSFPKGARLLSEPAEKGWEAGATGALAIFQMPWQALTGAHFPVERSRYFSLLARRQISLQPTNGRQLDTFTVTSPAHTARQHASANRSCVALARK